MKKIIAGAVAVTLIVVAVLAFSKSRAPAVAPMLSGVDPANTTYLIEGEEVLLVRGVANVPIAGSSTSVRTAIFGEQVLGDLDDDGDLDMALLLERQTGGSGTFYYVVAAIQNPDFTAQGTNGLYVGDRIAPQSMEIRDGVIIFNYASRKPDEPMTAQPSVGVSLYAKMQNGKLTEVQPVL